MFKRRKSSELLHQLDNMEGYLTRLKSVGDTFTDIRKARKNGSEVLCSAEKGPTEEISRAENLERKEGADSELCRLFHTGPHLENILVGRCAGHKKKVPYIGN